MEGGIVVIGTSLGGMQALRVLLSCLPGDFALPVAVVQHRDKNSTDLFSDYLREYCKLEIAEVCDKDAILPGHVFIAPADYHLLVEEGWFSVSTESPVQYSRPSIDVLFDSAAYVYGEKTIGALLTGANRDGVWGLGEIKKRGGRTAAQDPATAECDVMPGSAVKAGVVDRVLPLEAIGAWLMQLAGQKTPRKQTGRKHYGER